MIYSSIEYERRMRRAIASVTAKDRFLPMCAHDPPAAAADESPGVPAAAECDALLARYLVRVIALEPGGAAVARIETVLATPSAEVLAAACSAMVAPATPDDLLTFVGGLPGELIEVEARWPCPRHRRRRSRHTAAPIIRVVRVAEAAPERVAPHCPVFGSCGGCQLQHMDYRAQLRWKTARVREALAAAGMAAAPVLTALGCAMPWHYRNQMRFSVNRAGQPGLTARGSHAVLPLRTCPIASVQVNQALDILADEPLARPQLLLRYGTGTGQLLIQPPPSATARTRLAAVGLDIREDVLEERLGGARFRIRPSSFFQTNTTQAEYMAAMVLDWLPGGPDATLVDAYCGVGTFARLLAEHAGHVLAIEESASAVRDARWNLRELPNIEIVQAKVEAVLPQARQHLDGMVIDPPRTGCQPPVLDALLACRVPRVVYVSCEPTTFARDLAYLSQPTAGYRITRVQPLDMFPQTAHIECVALLEVA